MEFEGTRSELSTGTEETFREGEIVLVLNSATFHKVVWSEVIATWKLMGSYTSLLLHCRGMIPGSR
jgi:hypothetical protein